MRRLFEAEVNEISDHTVEIRGIARESGYRTKVAVWSNDPKVDPIGACVGVRGTRIKNITEELGGEKIDIIRWNESPEVLIVNALKPAQINSITLYEDHRKALVVVDEQHVVSLALETPVRDVRGAQHQLALAAGRRRRRAKDFDPLGHGGGRGSTPAPRSARRSSFHPRL